MTGNDLPAWVGKKEKLNQIETFIINQHLLTRVEAGEAGKIRLMNFWRAPVRLGEFNTQGLSMVEVASLNLRLEGPISTLHLVHYVSKA
ncbi:MAG: hypothetical protein AAFQ98_06865, partial [Bacteroidota bacterium]